LRIPNAVVYTFIGLGLGIAAGLYKTPRTDPRAGHTIADSVKITQPKEIPKDIESGLLNDERLQAVCNKLRQAIALDIEAASKKGGLRIAVEPRTEKLLRASEAICKSD
jgi:hypothetical protein